MINLKRISIWFIFVFFLSTQGLFCFAADTEEILHKKVIGDRVNVRARPNANSEVVTQLSAGEEVVVLGTEGDWTKIAAPKHTKCWVSLAMVEGNIVIKKDSVNLRSGPGVAYPVLAEIKKGTEIKIIENFNNEWIRIEPPVEFGVWVNSKYIEQEKSAEEKPKKEEEQEQPEPVEAVLPVVEQKPQTVSVPEEEIAGIELVTYAGKIEDLGMIINRPGTYKLLSDTGKWICIIKSPTLDLNPYVNRVVRLEGVVLAKSSSWDVPVIEVKKLMVIK